VTFALVHARKYKTKDIENSKILTIHELNTTQKKQTTQNTAKQNYSGSVAFYDTRPENEVDIFYDAPQQTESCTSLAMCLNSTGHAKKSNPLGKMLYL